MTLTLDLPPAMIQKLEAEAQRRSISLNELMLQLAEQEVQRLTQPFVAETPDDWEEQLDALLLQYPSNAPPLADDAVERAYKEREDAQL